MSNKNVTLVVATVMHEAVAEHDERARQLAAAEKTARRLGVPVDEIMEQIATNTPNPYEETARHLLCQIAHEAKLQIVLKALESIGAPHTLELIEDGFQAVRDQE